MVRYRGEMFYQTDLPAHSVLKMSLSLTGKVIFAISIILKQTKLKENHQFI